MSRKITVSFSRQGTQGQAATEFLIAALYVLVPLFLVIPLVGKYIDIKQAAIQQARFEAWEYTAWFMHRDSIMDIPRHHRDMRAAVRPWRETRKAGELIFFTDITSADYGTTSGGDSIALNPLWRDHLGKSLWTTGSDVVLKGSLRETETPNPSGKNYANDLIHAISEITKFVKKILNFEGQHAGFDALNTRGYFKSRVSLSLRAPEDVVPFSSLSGPGELQHGKLTFSGKAAVLADSWNAGSTQNAIAETKGLVLTDLLSPVTNEINHIINTIQKVLNNLHLNFGVGEVAVVAKLPEAPSFGYVKNGLIPYEHLEDNKKEIAHHKGLYYYRDKEE